MNEKTSSGGKLEGACCYLSGAMEYVSDHGIGWRRKFIELVRKTNIAIDFIDPTDKPGGIEIKIGENKQHQAELKKQGRWKELQEYVGAYRRYDLRFVDISDFLVAAIDPRVPQWGTANEIYEAEKQHKPLFFLCEGGIGNMPNWLFDVINLDDQENAKYFNVFSTPEELVSELFLYDTGIRSLSKEWVLVRKHIEQQREMLKNRVSSN